MLFEEFRHKSNYDYFLDYKFSEVKDEIQEEYEKRNSFGYKLKFKRKLKTYWSNPEDYEDDDELTDDSDIEELNDPYKGTHVEYLFEDYDYADENVMLAVRVDEDGIIIEIYDNLTDNLF
jgi:hypothetical protein